MELAKAGLDLSNLISYYQFEGDSTDSKGSNDGSDTAITYGSQYGRFGQGAIFNGSTSKVAIGHPATLANIFNAGGSFSGWVYPTDVVTAADRVYDKLPASTHGHHLYLSSKSGGVCYLTFAVGWSGGSANWITTDRAVTVNTWNHIVVTYNGSSTANDPICYINGATVALTESSSPSGSIGNDTNDDLYLGATDGTTRTLTGSMDDLAFFSQVLTAAQVKTLYEAGFQGGMI
jgi:hypothetical protein